jgi:hypothetical protein
MSRLVRRFLGCTVAGAGVVIFAKPLIWLSLVVGLFATIGFLLWLPLHAVVAGPHRTWQSVYGRGRRWFEPVGHKCRRTTATLRMLMERATPLVSNLLLEGLSGAVVAVVLVVAAGAAHNPRRSPVVPLAALCGALAGGLLALARRRREGRLADLEAAAPADHGASRSSSQPPSSQTL